MVSSSINAYFKCKVAYQQQQQSAVIVRGRLKDFALQPSVVVQSRGKVAYKCSSHLVARLVGMPYFPVMSPVITMGTNPK
ncbi:hypothetical protein V6N13_087424 [Hibiscus sabdariffa]|uniref:Uncharacterized protein n=1 Tax=Hibiscus sabdariffa TaxID=183260 RepID=A0ABR2FWL0_9ROSI